MSLVDSVELAILNCIDYILNTINGLHVPIIWAYEGGPIPDEPYILLNHISGTQDWNPYKSDVDTSDLTNYPDGKQTVFWTAENQVSVNAYGSQCEDYLNKIIYGLFFETVDQFLDKNGVSIVDMGDIKNVSILLDAQAEKRAAFDLRFRIGLLMIDSPGYITGVDMTRTITE